MNYNIGMKKLLFALLLMPSLVAAQSISVVYDFKSKTTSTMTTVASTRLVDNLFDIEWLDIDGLALAGFTSGRNRATVGSASLALALQPQIAGNLWGQIGLVGRMDMGAPVATGFLIGLTYRTKF